MWIQMKLARYQVAIYSLALLLQRAPLIRSVISIERVLRAPMAQIVRWATVGATALGSMNTYTGASTLVATPGNPAEGEVGEEFALVLQVTDTQVPAQSWRIEGSLPPGLGIVGLTGGVVNVRDLTIAGVPTTAGLYSFQARPWSMLNGTGETTKSGAFSIQINITGEVLPPVAPDVLVSRTNGGFLIEWVVTEGHTYTLETSTDLATWTEDGRTIVAEGAKRVASVTEQEVGKKRWLRVKPAR